MIWYGEEYLLRTADRFNHDYEQIFIFVHGILTLYKNVVILIATALFIGEDHNSVLLVTLAVGVLYYYIWQLLRKAHRCILAYYYDYKYEFVKVFGESVEGAQLIKIFGARKEVEEKAMRKYANLAGYTMAANRLALGQSLLCDFVSLVVTALSLSFGAQVVGDVESVSALATAIILLLNLSDVMKTMLHAAVQIQTFFRINIVIFC